MKFFFWNTLVVFLLAQSGAMLGHSAESKSSFWHIQKKGGNYFNHQPQAEWFQDAQAFGLQWIRMTYDKWPSQQRDFLIGNADHYQGLVAQDLALLKKSLDWAHAFHLKVVITPLTLPGARWSQNNNNQPDLRLWQDKRYWKESAQFWQDLARELAHHPAVYGYNLINEPTPERGTGLAEQGEPERYPLWYKKHQGTSHDLPAFYHTVIQAIRSVDAHTPIMLDAGWYAQPNAFLYWPKIKDEHILYAFHMYEPYAFTNHKNFKTDKFVYPGQISFNEKVSKWDNTALRRYFEPFFTWAKTNHISPNQIVAAEFGCYRRNGGCQTYLQDLITIFNHHHIHWAFYSFREDWEGYDYELGTGPLDEAYWAAIEKNHYRGIKRFDNPLFQVIKQQFH